MRLFAEKNVFFLEIFLGVHHETRQWNMIGYSLQKLGLTLANLVNCLDYRLGFYKMSQFWVCLKQISSNHLCTTI